MGILMSETQSLYREAFMSSSINPIINQIYYSRFVYFPNVFMYVCIFPFFLSFSLFLSLLYTHPPIHTYTHTKLYSSICHIYLLYLLADFAVTSNCIVDPWIRNRLWPMLNVHPIFSLLFFQWLNEPKTLTSIVLFVENLVVVDVAAALKNGFYARYRLISVQEIGNETIVEQLYWAQLT